MLAHSNHKHRRIEVSSSFLDALAGDGGVVHWRQVPLERGASPYWTAGARIEIDKGNILEAKIILADPEERLHVFDGVARGLVEGRLDTADSVHDEIVSALGNSHSEYGSKAIYLAGWVCADVVGHCITEGVR